MNSETIQKVLSLGFRVFMRDPKSTYMLYVDGKNIGYLQEDKYRGFCISTVHKPCRECGTGFQIIRDSATFTEKDLRDAFCAAPQWARNSDRLAVVKYRDIEHYRKANPFNSEYNEVLAQVEDAK